jgi:hypothetical protein
MPYYYGVYDGYGDENYRTRMLHRGLNLKTAPTGEPITLEEANSWDRVTNAREADLTDALITAARESVESFTRRQLNTAVWEAVYDTFPTPWGDPGRAPKYGGSFTTERWGMFELPKNPVQSVDEIKYIDCEGTEQILVAGTDYIVDTVSEPARITPAYDKFWPATRQIMGAVTITFTAGYGDPDADPNPVPSGLRQAMKLLILDMYQHRSAQSDTLLRENRLIGNLINQYVLPSLADIT